MNDMEQNSLTNKFLRIIRDWLNYIIPEETKNCIRSKTGIIVDRDENKEVPIETYDEQGNKTSTKEKIHIINTFDVVLSDNLPQYYAAAKNLGIDLSLPIAQRRQQSNYADFLEEVDKISIYNLFTVKTEAPTYAIDDYVIVGYLDNKLTNAFILCKNNNNEGER